MNAIRSSLVNNVRLKLVVVLNNLTNVTANNLYCNVTCIGRAVGSAYICL